MRIRSVLIPVVATAALLLGAFPASAAVKTTIIAADSGTAKPLPPTAAARCQFNNPAPAANTKCRYLSTSTFRTVQVHGVIQGIVTIDYRNLDAGKLQCGTMTGRLTVYVFNNTGRFLGTFIEQSTAGSEVCPTFLADGLTETLLADIVGGTGAYQHQHGSVASESASIAGINEGDPSNFVGRFTAKLVP